MTSCREEYEVFLMVFLLLSNFLQIFLDHNYIDLIVQQFFFVFPGCITAVAPRAQRRDLALEALDAPLVVRDGALAAASATGNNEAETSQRMRPSENGTAESARNVCAGQLVL